MPSKNPRLLNSGQPVPTLVVAALGGTGTVMSVDPGATTDQVIKQIILANLGAAANVVHIYISTSTTVTSAKRIIETSVPADSTIILYVNIRLVSTYMLYANATVANEVNMTLVGDVEAV